MALDAGSVELFGGVRIVQWQWHTLNQVNLLPKPVSSQRTNNEKMSTVCKNYERHWCSRSKRYQEKGAFISMFLLDLWFSTVHKFKNDFTKSMFLFCSWFIYHCILWKIQPMPQKGMIAFNQDPNFVSMLIRVNISLSIPCCALRRQNECWYLDLVSLALGLCVSCNSVNSPDLCEHRAKAVTSYHEPLPTDIVIF